MKVPINPEVLAWTMKDAGQSPEDLAPIFGVDKDKLQAWLTGKDFPTVTQFRRLSSVLKRPTATFLLPAPPKSAALHVAFRHAPDRANRPLSPKERLCLREAGRLQRGLRWVAQELEEQAVRLPRAETSADAEVAAAQLRKTIGVPVSTQTAWKSEYAAFSAWRAALERFGVVVLALPMGAESARGFSAWDEYVPIIAINTHWAASARIFSLFHEAAHLVSRTSSVCEESVADRHANKADPVERWCEAFSASFLMPWADVEYFLREKAGWDGRSPINSLAVATRIARRYRVSLRAAVIRLIGKGHAKWSLYRAIGVATEQKPEGGGGSGRTRPQIRIDEYGRRTARVFMRGLERDVLGRDDVLGYLDIGDAEFPDFEKAALSG